MGNNASDGNIRSGESANSNAGGQEHKNATVAPVPAPRISSHPPQRAPSVSQQPQTTRFQSVEPPNFPPPIRSAVFDENPPPYCDWASYSSNPPEEPIDLLIPRRTLIGGPVVVPKVVSSEVRSTAQRPQLPEPLIPGLAPPPTIEPAQLKKPAPDPRPLKVAPAIPTYRSKMEEAAQSGNFMNFPGEQDADIEDAPVRRVIIIDWEVEVKKIEKDLKKPPSIPKDASALFHDELKTTSKNRSKTYLVNNPYLSDVQFKVGKEQKVMFGHKLLLMSSSPVLLKELADKDELEVPSIEPETFLKLLKYCYTDEKKFDLESVFEIMAAAKYLQLGRLLCDASQFAHDYLNADKVFNLLEASSDAGNEKLKASCVKFIAENEAKVLNSKGFREISLKTLMATFKHCDFDAAKRAEFVEKFNTRQALPVTANVDPPVPPQATGTKPKQNVKKAKPDPQQKQKDAAGKKPASDISSSFEVIGSLLDIKTVTTEEFELIAKDDDNRQRVTFQGPREIRPTEFSRLDLVCKRSILLQEIGFTCDIGAQAKEARIQVLLWEKNVSRSIHLRVWNFDPKNRLPSNRLLLNKNPLKLFIGQKITIKVNFDRVVSCHHLNVLNSSDSNIIEIFKEIDKNYFNCISYIVVVPMTN